MKWRLGNLPEKEFRKITVKMIQDLRKRMEAKVEKMQKMFTKHQKNERTSSNEKYTGAAAKSLQSCPTLCDPMDNKVHGILHTRILEWLAFSFSRGSSQPRD